jgi:hypothetical protein
MGICKKRGRKVTRSQFLGLNNQTINLAKQLTKDRKKGGKLAPILCNVGPAKSQ